MAGQHVGGSAVLQWTSYMWGHHVPCVYCQEWTPVIGDVLALKSQPDNFYDKFAVAVIKDDKVVGHIFKPVSRAVSYVLSKKCHSGIYEVTGNCLHCGVGLGVEVPCIDFMVVSLTLTD